MTQKEKGTSPDQAAPQAFNDQHSTPFVFAPHGLACYVCNGEAHPGSTIVEVAHLGFELGIAVAVCPACTARAIAEDGSTDALIADIHAAYAPIREQKETVGLRGPQHFTGGGSNGSSREPLPDAPPTLAEVGIELQPRTARNEGRRHPAFGAALSADPPPADEHLRVLVGWEHADAVPDPKLIVRPADNPARLRFDVAAGRTVRIYHPHTADPNRLFSLAQSLIDYGATEVELVIHPPRPEAHSTELLRIVPKGGA